MISIDDRVGSKEIGPYLSVPYRLSHLESGDASWVGNGPQGASFIGVERKRLKDFINSMETGRLTNHQLLGMGNAYDYSYVVVEGIWRVNGKTDFVETPRGRGVWCPLSPSGSRHYTSAVMDNFVNAIQCMRGAIVVFTPSLARTGQWMSNVYKWWTNKEWGQHKSCRGKVSLPVPVGGPGRRAPLVARVAMELKGIGVDKAMKLAREFPSVEALCEAEVGDLCRVEGIGKGTAEGVLNQLWGKGKVA